MNLTRKQRWAATMTVAFSTFVAAPSVDARPQPPDAMALRADALTPIAFYGISVVSPTDAWIAGVARSNVDQSQHGLIRHWDGTRWRTIASEEPPGSADSWYFDVSADASDDAWTGGAYEVGGFARTLAQHWDGSAWQIVASPNQGNGGTHAIGSVSAVSPRFALGVIDTDFLPGASATAAPNTHPTPGTLIKWNGKAWKKRYLAAPRRGRYFMSGVDADSTTDGWAVGLIDHFSGTPTVAAHWDGTGWTKVETPSEPDFATLNAVTALSPDSAWAVGSLLPGWQATVLILRWNSGKWQDDSPPSMPGELFGVDALAENDAWAVGKAAGHPLTLHWDGSEWAEVSFPSAAGTLTGVSGDAANDVWTVGYNEATKTPILGHWDGVSWTLP